MQLSGFNLTSVSKANRGCFFSFPGASVGWLFVVGVQGITLSDRERKLLWGNKKLRKAEGNRAC